MLQRYSATEISLTRICNPRFFVLFFVCCCLSGVEGKSWGAWGESGAEIDLIRLEGYDRMYAAEIGIDTTMRILDPALRRRFLRAEIPFDEQKYYAVHCRYTVLYLWKDRFVVRFVVVREGKVHKRNLTGKRAVSLFVAKPFAPDKRYSCRCLHEEELLTDRSDPDTFTPDYRSRLAVAEGDSVCLYRYAHQQILWANEEVATADSLAMYHLINPYLMPYAYADLVEDECTAEDVILNYMYTRLFVNNKKLVKDDGENDWTHRDGVPVCYLLPSLSNLTAPLSPEVGKLSSFRGVGEAWGLEVSIAPIAPVCGRQAYRVTNSFPYTNRKNVRVSYSLLYVPQVLYLSEPMYRYRVFSIKEQ